MKKQSQKTISNSSVNSALVNSCKRFLLLLLTMVSASFLKAGDTSPVLSTNPGSLTGFSTFQNQASIARTYSLLATNLNSGQTATVTAPSGFEICVQGDTIFSSMLRLEQTSTGVICKTLEVRLKAQATNSNVAGKIIHEVGGSIKTVALSGTVKTALPFADMSTEECIMVGLYEEKMLQLNAYPTGNTDQFTVRFESTVYAPVYLSIHDLEGREILKQELPFVEFSQEINLSLAGQSAGLYSLEVISGTEHTTSKIIKN
jgi:hypothetical protein